MSDKTLNLTPELYDYLIRTSLRESAVLHELREQTHKMSMSQMQISPEQGQFMALLVKLIGARKTLDIGVFTGYSALVVAEALPPDGHVIACDINIEWTRIAKQFWEKAKLNHKIELKLAPALETLSDLIEVGETEQFDFAFIDADKANYITYYELVLKLLRPGGLMAIDNVLWSGQVADPLINDKNTVIIRQLNEIISQDSRISMSLIPIADGLMLVRKEF